MKSALQREFNDRLVELHSGEIGLRSSLQVEAHEVYSRGGDGEAPTLEFIASDGTVDRYNEVIKADAWELTNFRRNPVVLDSHDYSSVAKILGTCSMIDVKDGKLINRVRFATENPMGNLAYKMAKGGFIRSQSVGFIPLQWQNGKNASEPSVTHIRAELLEISLVAVPANPGATLGLALKSGAIEKGDVRDLADFLNQFCNGRADALANARGSGLGIHEPLTLRIARHLANVMRRA
jgi:HK97 family phage prohead protease